VTEKKINVLIVDDEKAIREMIIFALSSAGMKVRGAKSGNAALLKIYDKKRAGRNWHGVCVKIR